MKPKKMKSRRYHRKQVRHMIFRFLQKRVSDYEEDVIDIIDAQRRKGMPWRLFTFAWDIAPNNPLKPIFIEEWEKYGGQVKEESVELSNGSTEVRTRPLYPAGFTEQVISEE